MNPILLSAILALPAAVAAVLFAPSIWERVRRDNSPTTTAKPTRTHRAGV